MPRHVISKEIEFDAGHRVTTHQSKCRNVHGHRYRVRVEAQGRIVEDPTSPEFGMLTDFGVLKMFLTKLIHDPLDHGMIIWEGDKNLIHAMRSYRYENIEAPWKVFIFPYMPTAENLAKWCWDELKEAFDTTWPKGELTLRQIIVWETPTSKAKYRG